MSVNYIRGRPIYLSTEVYRYLRAIANALSEGTRADMSVDQCADNLLREAIIDQYPQLAGCQGKIEDLEKEMAQAIRGEPVSEPNESSLGSV